MNLFILAAGEGTRLRPHTQKTPKPALNFAGVPLAFYNLALLKDLAPIRTIVNTYYLPEKIQALFSEDHMQKIGWNSKVFFSNEGEKIRGCGGAISFAKSLLNQNHDTVLVNGDELILPHDHDAIQDAYSEHLLDGNYATIVTMEHPEAGTKFGAVWVDGAYRVRGFGKTPPSPGLTPLHYIGIQFLNPRCIQDLEHDGQESNIFYDDLVKAIAAGKKVKAVVIECDWYETGNPEDYLKASQAWVTKALPQSDYAKAILKHYSLNESIFIETPKAKIVMPKNMKAEFIDHIHGFAVLGENLSSEFLKNRNYEIHNSVLLADPNTSDCRHIFVS